MKEFFKVVTIEEVLNLRDRFLPKEKEAIDISDAVNRIAASDIISSENLPGFTRSTMDGYAIKAKSSFGASESNPALIEVKGSISMGEKPGFSIDILEAAKIATGGMLPDGADSVVMVEHTDIVDDNSIEVYKSVAPGQNVIFFDEDFRSGETLIKKGKILRPQEIGLLASFGISKIEVFKKPVVGIISTGDEIIGIDEKPVPGKVRDINSYSLSAALLTSGSIPVNYGIVKDNFDDLKKVLLKALKETDMVLLSGGSSVGSRDYTIDAISSVDNSKILVHGISISPGKPTILGDVNGKPVFGLPGHVVSAMVVHEVIVNPFIRKISGAGEDEIIKEIPAVMTRNVPSVPGRTDYVRVKLSYENGIYKAKPVMGKSGLLNTIVKADGLVKIDINTEGLYKEEVVKVVTI